MLPKGVQRGRESPLLVTVPINKKPGISVPHQAREPLYLSLSYYLLPKELSKKLTFSK
jgi:hypothetical protein